MVARICPVSFSTMKLSDVFCLKWNDFSSNMVGMFKSLRGDNDFTDVTLACEDGKVLEAHKVILAEFSPFFRNVLKMNKHPHPFIYLKGVQMRELASVVDFLYFGEVRVLEEDLEAFLALAAELQLKVLDDIDDMQTAEDANTNTKMQTAEDDRESGELTGEAVTVKRKKQAKVKCKAQRESESEKQVKVKYKANRESESEQQARVESIAKHREVIKEESGDRKKVKSNAERTRMWRARNKESVKIGVLRYLKKTAERRRVNSDFDKAFKNREAARKREWRMRRKILGLETHITT